MEKDQSQSIKRPSLLYSLTEAPRAMIELSSYFPYKYLKKIELEGDGHPVLVLPGFMASDFSTILLRKLLKELGYSPYGWRLGRNYAKEDYIQTLENRVSDLSQSYGKSVSLIGWSLGGVYARQIAKSRPDSIRQIITLASPFKGITKPNNAKWMYDILTRGKGTAAVDKDLIADIPNAAPVPTTAIYSKEDGVVPWSVCMEEESHIYQNVQVRGSHLGLAVNPAVIQIITDRLKYDRSNWERFESSDFIDEYLFYPSLNGKK